MGYFHNPDCTRATSYMTESMLLHSPPLFSLQMLWSHSWHCLTTARISMLMCWFSSKPYCHKKLFSRPSHCHLAPFCNHLRTPITFSSTHGPPGFCSPPMALDRETSPSCQSAPGTAQGSCEMFVTLSYAQMHKREK